MNDNIKDLEKDLIIVYRGKKLHIEKDAEELQIIYHSGLQARQELITALAIGLLLKSAKVEKDRIRRNKGK